ncbi:Uncharacterized conserved protein DUF1015 [Elusimicrobium minutum Pei191]|uniref:Uncharacterized conserved protein DUF1015 n=1 Tax=Elusimicrobium minutum (strain Pei191) TaxID=445932 RepID=B2KCL8_ELUMP|nr:DUF1015 family protein [Elusimicrobium minutum]ACC98264.1 Uncharacterized conserved protein DUF1015 [Elusimicrobium minutum Pei191]
MITVKPFKAIRPNKDEKLIASFPYDVINSEEARQIAKGNPLSFLHVEKPEIDLPENVDLYDPSVYAKGKENLEKFISEGILIQEDKPCFYLYAQTMDGRKQYGFVVAASTAEYGAGRIKRHEFTRKDKEADRTRHINTMGATTGPVFLAYKDSKELNEVIERIAKTTPIYNFTADDGIGHTVWKISDDKDIIDIEGKFFKLPNLYIADGHHRAASAYNTAQLRRVENHKHTGLENYNFFLAVVFPAEQLYIMDYNRAVKDFNGLSRDQFMAEVEKCFTVTKTDTKKPQNRHEFGMYLKGQWYTLEAKENIINETDPIKCLDVSILQDNLLGPVLGIDDPRTSKRIDFIGGIRGTAELEKYVNELGYSAAFSMFPTSMDELMKVADAGLVMPPKSTWFEPKLRSGLLTYKY